jgi:hypothetical protein
MKHLKHLKQTLATCTFKHNICSDEWPVRLHSPRALIHSCCPDRRRIEPTTAAPGSEGKIWDGKRVEGMDQGNTARPCRSYAARPHRICAPCQGHHRGRACPRTGVETEGGWPEKRKEVAGGDRVDQSSCSLRGRLRAGAGGRERQRGAWLDREALQRGCSRCGDVTVGEEAHEE